MLKRISTMSIRERTQCYSFIQWGLLAPVRQEDEIWVSAEQLATLQSLQLPSSQPVDPLQLFASEHEFFLSDTTGLLLTSEKRRDTPGYEVLRQLLPRIVKDNVTNHQPTSLGRITLPGQGLDVLSKDFGVLHAVEAQVSRFLGSSLQRDRVSTLARSANYMGAKTLLCPAISEVLESYLPSDAVVIDLMCGSGATAGALARRWKTYASDAQSFSRNLALIQGGGMTATRAKEIVTQVIELAKPGFLNICNIVGKDIEKEEAFLMSELNVADKQEFIVWACNYPRLNTERFTKDSKFSKEIELRRGNKNIFPPLLFTMYYANLFFGVRQSAEIDCLRAAIAQLENSYEQKWALGALICAVSACADNYGGHFAQPRFDSSFPEKLLEKLDETISRRTMSLTQEFSARLVSLASESEHVLHTVEEIDGPWQRSIEEASSFLHGRQVAVYLDPPYTRDEYSRYYHVLETLVRYDYPVVSGKASIPVKGPEGRFASEFFTRSSTTVEDTIAKVITSCLENQWSCLWSYSSGGIANVPSVIERLGPLARHVDIYNAKYSYKPQGKRKLQDQTHFTSSTQIELPGFSTAPPVKVSANALASVDEYMIMIRP
jgi:adenine-specific DNA-methyltransferase